VNSIGRRYGRGLVIGGGIAGPVVGMALQRVGIDSAIFEASSGPSDGVGAFLTVASNGIDALQAIDAHRPVVAAGVRTERMVLSSGRGKFLGAIEAGVPLTDGSTTTTIERGTLYRLLHDEARRRRIPIAHGKRLVGIDETSAGVIARFADGSAEEGGFLVGADGIWSTTRSLLHPEAPRPEYTGLIGLGGRARGVDLDTEPFTFEMIFGARAFFGLFPVDRTDVLWFANLPVRPEPERTELAAVSAAAWRERLVEAFAADAFPARALIDATHDEDLKIASMHTLEPPASWYGGRSVLVGDAAHVTSPSSGQGASLAMEDAVELAVPEGPEPSRLRLQRLPDPAGSASPAGSPCGKAGQLRQGRGAGRAGDPRRSHAADDALDGQPRPPALAARTPHRLHGGRRRATGAPGGGVAPPIPGWAVRTGHPGHAGTDPCREAATMGCARTALPP